MQTSCLRSHHRCDELNEFWLRLQFVKFVGRLRPFVKLMKTVSNSSNSLFKLKGGKVQLRTHLKKSLCYFLLSIWHGKTRTNTVFLS